jgi:hypothetical protein
MNNIETASADGPAASTNGVVAPRLILSADNGFTGAIAGLLPDGRVICHPVKVLDMGRERFLDVDGNLQIIREIIKESGVDKSNVLFTYEQSQINSYFGYKSNFTNGKNGEFWRVLLSREKIAFNWVNPKQWQKEVFRAVRGVDTKAMADMVRRQRFPNLDLSPYNRSEVEGINDAICIALYARIKFS